jgi:hypothetical protein
MASLSAANDEVAKQWLEELKGACNDLTKHYLNLLKSASPSASDSSSSALDAATDEGSSSEAIVSLLLDKEMAADQAMLDYAAAVQAAGGPGGGGGDGTSDATRPRDVASSVAASSQALALQTRVSCDNIVEQAERLLMLISQLRNSVLLSTQASGGAEGDAAEARREALIAELLKMEK